MSSAYNRGRFHGRFESEGQECRAPGCREPGEFRAPGPQAAGFDGPGSYFWFCLDHVREFNAGYDWFEGMSAEEIFTAQSPLSGWRTENRTFSGDAGIDGTPRWADFDDPLDAISGRAAAIRKRAAGNRTEYARFTAIEQAALTELGLDEDIDRAQLRRRYSELVRKYHPDRNGGDRSYETRLGKAVDAYQVLKKSAALR